MGAGLLPHDRDRLEPVVAEARQSAGSEAFAAAWREGRGLSLEHAFELALDGEEPAVGQAGAADQAPTTSTSRALEVHALGVVEILVNSRRVPPSAWRYTRPREVLLYLLAHPEGRTREQIGLVFWPDSTALQVKNSFHVSLHHLRKALGRSDLITFEGDRYRMAWELGVWFDAQAFESAMVPLLRSRSRGTAPPPDEAALGNALALYRGDFLAEEGAGDWHLPVRERLQKLCVDGLLMLAECQSQRGAHDEAVKTLSRLVATDPLHENAQRRLMTSMARAGDRSAALRQYERFARLLRSEMEAEPEGVTTALYRRLQTADPVAD
jgi:DNA-binding SARP family transcriptional activator